MEPEQTTPSAEPSDKFENLKIVTPLSRYIAMVLFILMPFIGGWIGYTYAPEKVVEVEKVVFSDTLPRVKVTPILENEVIYGVSMPWYKFNNQKGKGIDDSQVIVEGILAPVLLQAMGRSSTTITLRCQQKTMDCLFATLIYSDRETRPILKLENLKVLKWDDNVITVEGIEGTYPDCERDFCTSQVRFTLDIKKREGSFFQTFCSDNCATDEYIITGQKYGELTPPVMPVPVEKWKSITN